MDPAIRIVCLVVFGLLVSLGGAPALLPGILIVLIGYAGPRLHLLRSGLPLLRRLRFLFLSLALVYLWFTPGVPLLPELGDWSPSVAGMWQAAVRISVLVSIVFMVHLLLQTTTKEQLISGILWLAAPLQKLGFATTRLAVRISLTVHMMESILARGPGGKVQGQDKPLDYLAQRIALRYQEALAYADNQLPLDLEIQPVAAPPLWQWCYPLLLTALMLGVPGFWF